MSNLKLSRPGVFIPSVNHCKSGSFVDQTKEIEGDC